MALRALRCCLPWCGGVLDFAPTPKVPVVQVRSTSSSGNTEGREWHDTATLSFHKKETRWEAHIQCVEGVSDEGVTPQVVSYLARVAAASKLPYIWLVGREKRLCEAATSIEPSIPLSVLLGEVKIRLAQVEDRKAWNALVVSSSKHNLGGHEMVALTSQQELRLVAETTAGELVGLICVSASGWITYLTCSGMERCGLGAHLLFLALEWLRLRGVTTVSLSPSDATALAFYQRWGFVTVHPSSGAKCVPLSDTVMMRRIPGDVPLFPLSLFKCVEGMKPPPPRQIVTYSCPLCMSRKISSVARYSKQKKYREHIESHFHEVGAPPETRRLCLLIAEEAGWTVCGKCEERFDEHGCEWCESCAKRPPPEDDDRPTTKHRRCEAS